MASIYVKEETLPRAWEVAVKRTWEEGDRVKTEYDKPKDLESRDVNAFIHVVNPFKQPRIHRAFPGGLEELESYRLEVVEGIHDHWIPKEAYDFITRIGKKLRHKMPLTETDRIALKNSDLQKWSYTYYQRLLSYETPDGQQTNQFDEAIEKLVESQHSRRAVISLLKPWGDIFHHDPPCLNLIAFRVFDDKLRMHVTMRSNDAFKAAFMNMWAFTDLQRKAAESLSERLDRKIIPGEYTHNSISFHIYGSYFSEFNNFLETLEKRSFEDRTWDSSSETAKECFADARKKELEWKGDKELPLDKRAAIISYMTKEERERITKD